MSTTSPRVVVVGGGGREHALVAALASSPSAPRVEAAPGNPGMADAITRHDVTLDDLDALEALCLGADLVVVGPEAPLVAGLADRLRARGLAVLGPSQAAAKLEGSKAFAKEIMARAGVPTARGARFSEPEAAKAFAATLTGGAVVKADGLAAGKGVVVAEDLAEAEAAIDAMLSGAFGEASREVVVEEKLVGEELSVLALCDGARLATLPPAQDHKRIGEGDTGPNTGGMGAYAPAPLGTPAVIEDIRARCMQPVVDVLAADGTPLVGVLYAGLMMTAEGPLVLEYNVRFGDPETQAILPLLSEDLYLAFRAAALGTLEARPLAVKEGSAMTVVMASAGYPASARKGDLIEGLDAVPAEDRFVFHAGTRRGAEGFETAGGRVLAVTGLGADLATAAARAYAGIDLVRFDGAQVRRDIGHRALKAD